MTKNDRVVHTRTPLSLWIKAVSLGLLALALVLAATWQFGATITAAKMTGTIVAKEFKPLENPENQITLNKDKSLRTDRVDGDYIITVEVPQKDGTKRAFTVWLNDKTRYDALQVGDSFDVGPYLVRD
ncbi:MAG: hypothetical protein ACOYNG_05625 [Terrimicrobiaceae bacterium]|jgi:hypothetical protein